MKEKPELFKISQIAQFGISQNSFWKHFSGTYEANLPMMIGTQKHQEIEDSGEKITHEETMRLIKSSEPCSFIELFVLDRKHGIKGIIDGVELNGVDDKINKNLAIIVERKFTSTAKPLFYDSYKIQMAGYSLALKNDPRFEDMVEVVGGILELNRMDEKRKKIIETVQLKAKMDNLLKWEKCIPKLTNIAKKLALGKSKPSNVRYSVDNDDWLESKW